MDSPKSTTKRNIGSHATTAPLERKSSSPSAQVCWKTSTSSPYAAATESRFSAIAVVATTTERKETSTSTNVSPSTKAITHGSRALSIAEKSTVAAVPPPTAASAPGTRPTVSGTRVVRSSERDSFARGDSSRSGIATVSTLTVRSVETSRSGCRAAANSGPPFVRAARSSGADQERQRRAAQRRAQHGRPQPGVAVRPHRQPVDEGHPRPVHPAPEGGQHRGQHRYRAEHGNRDDEDRAERERAEDPAAGEEHPGHRDRDGAAGDDDRPTRRRCRDLDRVERRTPAGPLLADPPDVEERVVDADRHADQQDHAGGRLG